MQASAASAPEKICHQLTPAMNTTNAPLAPTKMAVPKSGWVAIAAAGSAMIKSAVTVVLGRGGRACRTTHAATINGMAIFMISDG